MSRAFVIGNGVSRQQIELSTLQALGKVYGCNALYRDFVPNVLVSTDKPISEKIQNSGYPLKNKHYTRKPIPGLGSLPVPQEYFGFSSGPIATSLAALDGAVSIYLVGFDMGPYNRAFNNVYADTEFYKKSNAPPTFTGNWAKQLVRIAKDFPNCMFYRVHGTTTAVVPEFEKVPNLKPLDMSEFLNRINNTKDL